MSKTARLEVRLSESEKERIDRLAKADQTTASAMLRTALSAVVNRKPLLTPKDVEVLAAVREEVRRVGINLNALLRSVHLEEHGVRDNGPRLADYQKMAAELNTMLDRLTRATRTLPL